MSDDPEYADFVGRKRARTKVVAWTVIVAMVLVAGVALYAVWRSSKVADDAHRLARACLASGRFLPPGAEEPLQKDAGDNGRDKTLEELLRETEAADKRPPREYP